MNKKIGDFVEPLKKQVTRFAGFFVFIIVTIQMSVVNGATPVRVIPAPRAQEREMVMPDATPVTDAIEVPVQVTQATQVTEPAQTVQTAQTTSMNAAQVIQASENMVPVINLDEQAKKNKTLEEQLVPVVLSPEVMQKDHLLIEDQIAPPLQEPLTILHSGMEVIEEPVSNEATTTQALVADDQLFDENAKRKAVVELVSRGVDYFNQHSIAESCYQFSHTKNFIEGELYLFMYSSDGTVFADGQQVESLWKNEYNKHDSFGMPVVQSIIQKARSGGGWVIYNWRNATKVSYVKEVKKEGKTYVIGTGYYPHSKPDAVVNLVKGAVSFFNKMIKEGRHMDDAFSPLSYPIGRFVYGDLYLYALDFKGNNLAHGDRPGLIGTNSWDYKDSAGVLVNQEIVKKLSASDKGIWIEYMSGGALKRSYIEKMTDAQGNNYFIGCGYYPDANRNKVVDLVRKGYQFMKTHGLSQAEIAFSDTRSTEYRYGDLSLFLYDLEGNILTQASGAQVVGQNQLNRKDDDGRPYVRDFIQKAQDGGGWVDIKLKGSFKSVYVEKVDLGVSSFVLGSGIYPISKNESMELLAKSGADYLQAREPKDAFVEFVNKDGKFVRGDLYLFVFDTDGICYVFGDENSVIWRPLLDAVDDNGVRFVQEIINTVKYGASEVRYTLNGVEKVGYVKSVQKGDKVFIVGSSYFR